MKDGAASGGLKLQALTKRFGSFTAAENVDLDIRRGEFLTLLGPSGSGKTTLLMMIAGFLDITEGDILLDGRSIAGMPPERRNFGMVFQGYALFPHMTVRQNIAYPLDVRKRPKAEIEARVDEMLDLVQLQEFGHRLPGQLSGGQQQRVALARALCFAPPVLLLDEPLGALDKKLRIEVQDQLKDIHRRVGTTFIYVTHDQEEALSMSDRIVIMQAGPHRTGRHAGGTVSKAPYPFRRKLPRQVEFPDPRRRALRAPPRKDRHRAEGRRPGAEQDLGQGSRHDLFRLHPQIRRHRAGHG